MKKTIEEIIKGDLQKAFEAVRRGREALIELVETDECGFHNKTWEEAFFQAFDRILTLKTAHPRDAAILGKIYIEMISSLVNRIHKEPQNTISIGMFSSLFAGSKLDEAKKYFAYVLIDLKDMEDESEGM